MICRVGKTLLFLVVCLVVAGVGVFIHYYNVYSKMIDERLRGGPYSTTARIFAAPTAVAVDDPDFALRNRRHPPPRRVQREPHQSRRLLHRPGRFHRHLPRRRFLLRSGARHGQVRRRQNHPHRLPAPTTPAARSMSWSRSSSPTSPTATAKSSASCITKTSRPSCATPCSPPRTSASSSIPVSIPSALSARPGWM